MSDTRAVAAVYDFALFPYALGDVLTWNVRTAVRCEEVGRKTVDVYICIDDTSPAGVFQRGLVTSDNCDLFFTELYGAFGTHPCLGNIHIYRRRSDLMERLQYLASGDQVNAGMLSDYQAGLNLAVPTPPNIRQTLFQRLRTRPLVRRFVTTWLPGWLRSAVRNACAPPTCADVARSEYFVRAVCSHEAINAFYARHGRIPLLRPGIGCESDVSTLLGRQLRGRYVVSFHMRLRRLDAGYGGKETHSRDSDFLEWHDFLREASKRYPRVQFVALGRLQEKPLELLRMPNVMSLRSLGMGLGHELNILARSHLFMGTSSGFSAYAVFSPVPYFITKMNRESCTAYGIVNGSASLPFARSGQNLVYERETSAMLIKMLETGLSLQEAAAQDRHPSAQLTPHSVIDLDDWLHERIDATHPSSTTLRFTNDEPYREAETAFLILPHLERARRQMLGGLTNDASATLDRISSSLPSVSSRLAEFALLRAALFVATGEKSLASDHLQQLEKVLVESGRMFVRLQPVLNALRKATQSGDCLRTGYSAHVRGELEKVRFAQDQD